MARVDALPSLHVPLAASSWVRLWGRLAIEGLVLVGVIFGGYELVERAWLAGADPRTLHALHIARGAGTAFLLATWSFLRVRRAVSARAELVAAQVRHHEKMAVLGVLAAGIAHDIGNPLASLSTELEMLEGEEDAARLRESLDVLRRHVGRMSRTLREVVDFARRRRDAATDVSIAIAVADSARLVCHDPRWRRVNLVVDVPADLPRVRMVEDHLVLVLVNLIFNAVDAMPDGGEIRIDARARDRAVDVRVRDTGTGMTPDVLAAIGSPFFTTKGGRGAGLGLALCLDVVRSIGGDIAFASAPGEGTTVTISLPADGAADG